MGPGLHPKETAELCGMNNHLFYLFLCHLYCIRFKFFSCFISVFFCLYRKSADGEKEQPGMAGRKTKKAKQPINNMEEITGDSDSASTISMSPATTVQSNELLETTELAVGTVQQDITPLAQILFLMKQDQRKYEEERIQSEWKTEEEDRRKKKLEQTRKFIVSQQTEQRLTYQKLREAQLGENQLNAAVARLQKLTMDMVFPSFFSAFER